MGWATLPPEWFGIGLNQYLVLSLMRAFASMPAVTCVVQVRGFPIIYFTRRVFCLRLRAWRRECRYKYFSMQFWWLVQRPYQGHPTKNPTPTPQGSQHTAEDRWGNRSGWGERQYWRVTRQI